MAKRTGKASKAGDVVNFRPPEDVRLMLQKAQEATGASRTDLIIEAIRTDLAKVVKKLIAERRRLEDDYLSDLASEDQAKRKTAS